MKNIIFFLLMVSLVTIIYFSLSQSQDILILKNILEDTDTYSLIKSSPPSEYYPEEIPSTSIAAKLSSNISNTSNQRWNHLPLTVYIDDSFIVDNPGYYNDFVEALRIWESTGVVSFLIVRENKADISVKWVATMREGATDASGDTKVDFIRTDNFSIIQHAEIEMLTKTKESSIALTSKDMTNLALHEIGHAIGLDHTNDKDDVMYPNLEVPSSKILSIPREKLAELYRVPALPDFVITDANATKIVIKRFLKEFYFLNVSMEIKNIGLVDADTILDISADIHQLQLENLANLTAGSRIILSFSNLMVPNNFNTIDLYLDPQNDIEELNETNNHVKLVL